MPTSAAVAAGAVAIGSAFGSIHGVPVAGAMGVQESTATIMARQAFSESVVPPRVLPIRIRNRPLPPDPDAPAVSRWPSQPGSARTSEAPQTLGTSFTGATLADTGAFPPDTMGAVGPSQFVVAVRGRIRSFTKAGSPDGVLNTSLDIFFAPVVTPNACNFTLGPRIRYDRLSARWFLTATDVPGCARNQTNRVLVAVSDAASAGVITSSTVWTLFYFQASGGNFADYETLGVDANALYIGANIFDTSGSFVSADGYVVRKSSVLGAGPIVVTAFTGLIDPSPSFEGPFAPQGIDNDDPAATEGYFVGVSNAAFGRLDVRRVSNPGGVPSISGNILVSVPTTSFPESVPHLGNTGGPPGKLDALDDRLFAAHVRNGRLWTAHNIEVDGSGVASSTGSRDGVRWYELQDLSGSPSVFQAGTVFDSASSNPRYYWMPTIMVSGQGHAALGFSQAGANDHADAATAGRLAGDALGTTQTVLPSTTSSTSYNPPGDPGTSGARRWGEYSYTSLDPLDDMTIWTIQEFCDSADSYGLRVVKLVAQPPATPSSASPATVTTGQASVNVTITGTVVSGSGFYDPGTNLASPALPFAHVAASVTGGVTVNSVTYNSPTSVTLDVSTVGASTGSQDVTITNPDGQSQTGRAILEVGPPTAVLVARVSATRTADGVIVRWRTSTDGGLLGFDVYRASERLNRRPVLARASTRGHAYSWLDREPTGAAYRIQAILLDGSRVWLATAEA